MLKDYGVYLAHKDPFIANKFSALGGSRLWTLFKTIKHRMKETYLIRLSLNNMTRRLLHIDRLRKIVVDKGVGGIKQVKTPSLVKCDRQKNAYRIKVNKGREGLLIIHPILM